jgi:diguanylate cyclase (GGDEF)-like protein
MPAFFRLPLALAACALVTALVSLGLWRQEQADVRRQADERATGAAAAIEERAGAAILALQGVRAAYDASGSVDEHAFATHARVPLARPEVVAVGWAPRVAAAQRGEVEAVEQVRIGAPTDALFTYPLLRQQPAASSPDVLDLGSDPSLGQALRESRTSGEPRLSAPVRLQRDGRLGTFAFVPVFARGLPLDTPAERRDALLGVVAGALSADELLHAAFSGLPRGLDVRVTDGAAVLAHGSGGPAVARARLGGRTWNLALAPAAASPLVPVAAAGAGSFVLLLLSGAALLLRRRAAAAATLEQSLADERRARRLVSDASEALVLELDRDGIVRSCSAAAEQLLGWTPADLIGSELYALLHPDDLITPANGPQRYVRSDGTYVVLEGRRLSRRDEEGFVTGVVCVLRGAAAAGARTAEQRLQDAVALEPDPLELFSVVAEEVARDVGAASAAVVRFETGGFGTIAGAYEPRGSTSLMPGTTVQLEGDEPAAHVFRTGQAVSGATPLRVGARLWGAVVADGDPDRLAALALAAQAAIAFADASAQLGALATRDQLTNLPDHRAFHEQLRAETRRAERHERALSVVLVDVDGFKRINAEHGRLAGDRALAELARRLAATVRNGELVSRLAADHFGWILPETEGLNGWIAAERARRAVTSAPFDGVGTITVSAAVCDFDDAGGADQLLALAELALAHAKSSGGDATFRFSAELDEGMGGGQAQDDRGLARLRALALELDAEDGTEGHSERVSRLAEKLALSSGWPADRAISLAQAALLHDVGKLGIDDDVLHKAGPLSPEELEQIRNHPDTGAELAVKALDAEQLGWIRQHHERWNGAGYPHGLAGEAIAPGARLLALAEAWDAMTTRRSYGEALAPDAALAECRRERGAQFAPEAVDALDRLWALGALAGGDVRGTTRSTGS